MNYLPPVFGGISDGNGINMHPCVSRMPKQYDPR